MVEKCKTSEQAEAESLARNGVTVETTRLGHEVYKIPGRAEPSGNLTFTGVGIEAKFAGIKANLAQLGNAIGISSCDEGPQGMASSGGTKPPAPKTRG